MEENLILCAAADGGKSVSAALQYGRQYCGWESWRKGSSGCRRYSGSSDQYIYRIFPGMSAEAGVVIFQYYGAKDEKKVSRILSGVRHFVTHQRKDYSFMYRYGGDFF